MIFGIDPIRPADLFALMQARVQTVASLPADCCFISLAGEDDHLQLPPADQFVALFPEQFPIWQSVVTGAGREWTGTPGVENLGFDGHTWVRVYSRLSTNQEVRSGPEMTSVALGVAGLLGRVLKAVQFWMAPTNVSETNSYLREPARVSSGPRFHTKRLKSGLWSICTFSWETRFTVLVG